MSERGSKHPRDTFITVFGRKPVLEALSIPGLAVDKLLLANDAGGPVVRRIEQRAQELGIDVRRVAPRAVHRISRNARQDQGVVLDVLAPRMDALEHYLEQALPERQTLFVLDGLTTPANVGMAIRSITAAGMHGIVVPRVGCPEIGPLVVKASAGLALRAPILRTPNVAAALDQLGSHGFVRYGLDAEATHDLYDVDVAPRSAWVIGNESVGLSNETRERIDVFASIPMARGVESLNAAVTTAVVAFELRRRNAQR